MSKKIVNIVVFAVSILACLAAFYFAALFDSEKKDKYYEIATLKENNPQLLKDLTGVTLENLAGYIAKYKEEAAKLTADLKTEELEKNVEHTFIYQLSELKEEDFPQFKSDFPQYANRLLIKSKRLDFFVKGFNNVANFAALSTYITSLENDYAPVKQLYLKNKAYSKSYNAFLGRLIGISEDLHSAARKTVDLKAMQDDVSSAITEAKTLSFAIVLVYIVFFATLLLLLGFALIQIVVNIKNSYKAILAIAGIVVILLLGYLISPDTLSTSAIKMQHTAGEVKIIGSGLITVYILLLAALAAIVGTYIVNAIKNIR